LSIIAETFRAGKVISAVRYEDCLRASSAVAFEKYTALDGTAKPLLGQRSSIEPNNACSCQSRKVDPGYWRHLPLLVFTRFKSQQDDLRLCTNAHRHTPVLSRNSIEIKGGILVEHWDVTQDEATREQSKSGKPMLGDAFPVYA
jgi:hypothetical protein